MSAAPLYSEDAERAATLSVLAHPASAKIAFDELTESDFYTPHYRALWLELRAFYKSGGQLTDELSLVAKLERDGKLDSLGGKQEIGRLYGATHSGANIVSEIAALKDFAQRRRCNDTIIKTVKLLAEGNTAAVLREFKTAANAQDTTTVPLFQFAGEIIDQYASLRPPVVHGLLREGETMNVIAPPKTGKTWLTLDLALSVATGANWLNCNTVPGRVLIFDNELHGETIANRLPKVAEAKGIPAAQYRDAIAYRLLRGNLRDIFTLSPLLDFDPGYFKVIVLDAFYRFLPKDTDENDNGSMAGLYNQIDSYADRLSCAFVLIHHTSKGLQTGRAVTDVGAGAGAISRAADCHLILRPHAEDGAVVLDATPRSWPPVPSTCLRYDFPLWKPAPDLDPTDLKKPKAKAKKPDATPVAGSPKPEWTPERFAAAFITTSPKLRAAILADANDMGLTDNKAGGLLEKAEAKGLAFRWNNGPKKSPSFATTEQPQQLTLNEREGEDGFPLEGNSKGTGLSSPSKARQKTGRVKAKTS